MKLYKINDNSPISHITQSSKTMLEADIEELLENNPVLLTGENILCIGRQVSTDTGKKLDLLAVDKFRRLIVIELKKDYAPREIIAQALDYTSWLNKLSEREIEKIAKDYFENKNINYQTLHDAYYKTFGKLPQGAIGEEISIILFAKGFSQEVIRPAEYLNDKGVPIRCIKFEIFGAEDKIEYFTTQIIVGDEQDNENEVIIPLQKKASFREIIEKLTKYLEATYGDWSLSLGAERTNTFRTYQNRQGDWACSYIEWLYKNETKFYLDFGIYSENEQQWFCLCFASRTKSENLTNFFKSGADILDLLDGYKNESARNRPSYTKYIKTQEISFELVKEATVSEFEKIKPLIEAILK